MNPPPLAPAAEAPPPPIVFKSIGYVESGEGQLEAIILQDNEVQVVHIGDHISGRYRVTHITHEMVDAIDETLPGVSQAKADGSGTNELNARGAWSGSSAAVVAVNSHAPSVSLAETAHERSKEAQPRVDSLGYVQRADGKVEAVMADGDSVRLVSQTPTESMAEATAPDRSVVSRLRPVAETVRKVAYQVPTVPADGLAPSQSGAASAEGGVHEVDPAGEPGIATAKPPETPPSLTKRPIEIKPLGYVVKADGTFAAILSEDDEIYIVRQGDRFAGRYRAASVSAEAVEATEEPPRKALPLPFEPSSAPGHRQDLSATFVFQTLGYVQAQDGEMQAVVADGRDIYLVRQGETFADQYQATSVDPILVLAVRVFPEERAENFLGPQTDPGREPASNQLFTHLYFPTAGMVNAGAFREASGRPLLADWNLKLFGSSSTGDDAPSYFFDGR